MAITKAELYRELRAPEPGTKPFTKAGNNLNLLPTLTGGRSAFKRGGMEYAIADLDEVQNELDVAIAKAYSRAQAILAAIRTAVFSFGDIRDHWVELDTEGGDIDRKLRLTDTKNGTKGAMSIEFGRGDYEAEHKDGSRYTVKGMTGKYILHRAFDAAPNSLPNGGGDA